jgi:hypothetical protein
LAVSIEGVTSDRDAFFVFRVPCLRLVRRGILAALIRVI